MIFSKRYLLWHCLPFMFYNRNSQTTFENEIACIDVNAIDGGDRHASQVCAVGLWTNIKVLLVRLPTMEILASHDLPGDILPRSLLLSRFEGVPYLLVGLGKYF